MDHVFVAAGGLLGVTLLAAALRASLRSCTGFAPTHPAARHPAGLLRRALVERTLFWPDAWPLVLVVVVAATLNLTGITWGLPNVDDDWAIDSIAPLGPLSYAERMLYGGQWWSKYPPLHFTLLAFAYAPYVLFLALTGGLEPGVGAYPYGLGAPAVSLPLFTLMARLVSAAMGTATAVVAYAIACELTRRRAAGLAAGLFFSGSPLTVYYAHTANLDVPYMFWSSLALLYLVRVARGAGPGAYALLGAFTAAAIATKDQAYGLFLLMPIPLLWMQMRPGAPTELRDGRLLAGLFSALVVYGIAANVVIDPGGWLEHVRFITHEGSRPYRMFPATVAGYAALAQESARLTATACGPVALLLAAVGAAATRRGRFRGAGLLAFAACSYLVLFLGPILYVLPRFVLPVVFVVAVFAGLGAVHVWDRWPGLPRVLLAGAVAYGSLSGAAMNVGLLRDSRYAAEEWMTYNLPAGAVVGLDGPNSYLPRLPEGTPSVRVAMTASGPHADVEPEFLVLSEAHYRRYLRREPLRGALERLLAGELGFTPVATFYRDHPRVTGLIPGLSPRIVILRRTTT
jgi:hypothetical protein